VTGNRKPSFLKLSNETQLEMDLTFVRQ